MTAFVPFLFQYDYIINAFYRFGAPYFDAGLFSNLLWHNDFLITTPRPRGDHTYLGVHFSPFLVLINLLSYCTPFAMAEFYGVFMACIYASVAVSMYWMLMSCVRPRRIQGALLMGLLGVGFSFNGFVMQGVWMPHFEYAVAPAILAFLVLLGEKRYGWATCVFVFALCIREDVGFHIAAVLGLLAGLRFLKKRSLRPLKYELIFLGAAVAYSVFATVLISSINKVNGVENVMQFIYTGKPAYAHLTASLLLGRLPKIMNEHLYLWLGFLITLGWSIRTRNPYWMVGFAAYIPWFVFNWTAYNENTGSLYAYYCFPFVLSMGWPCIGTLWRHDGHIPYAGKREAILLQALLVSAGLLCWNTEAHAIAFGPYYWARWGSYETPPASERREAIRNFLQGMDAASSLGVIMADDGTMSLTIGSNPQKRGPHLLLSDSTAAIHTLVYFNPFNAVPEDLIKQVKDNRLGQHYCVTQTVLCLFTDSPKERLPTALSALLTETPSPIPK